MENTRIKTLLNTRTPAFLVVLQLVQPLAIGDNKALSPQQVVAEISRVQVGSMNTDPRLDSSRYAAHT